VKIAVVAHGRFHAFDYARELLRHGHDVRLITNYPASYVERWGVPRSTLRTYPAHGVAGRVLRRFHRRPGNMSDRLLHRAFGRFAERAVRAQKWDVILCWSSVGEEIMRSRRVSGVRVCHRSSAHIRTQDRLLREEQDRTGLEIERPSGWMIAREEREYALADLVLVPSSFARSSFLAEGLSPDRILMVPFGVDPAMFRPARATVEERVRRIEAGEPLRVAYVGAISLRKGMRDLVEIARSLDRSRFAVSCTGPIAVDCQTLARDLEPWVTLHGPRPQRDLPATYAAADLFVFPTIEDGHPMVLSQAMESALPIVCTTNCSGPDIIADGQTGWVLPPRRPDLFIERLQWCDTNRGALVRMIWDCYERFASRTWADATRELAAALAPAVGA
jgi:glycosyltransferase involved in cell wall biosynthesis